MQITFNVGHLNGHKAGIVMDAYKYRIDNNPQFKNQTVQYRAIPTGLITSRYNDMRWNYEDIHDAMFALWCDENPKA